MDSFLPREVRNCAILLAASAVLACNDDPTSNDTPYVVVPMTTGVLAGTPGRALAETLVVEVRTADGHPVPGATVDWTLPQGGSLALVGAKLNGATSGTTDDKGRAYALWTLGLPEGTQQAKVAVGLGEPATFTATATALHVRAVSVGSGYLCAVLTDQRPVCWGSNFSGQLGTGDTIARGVPTPVTGLSAVLEIRASPDGHTCARVLSGDVWCWGSNYFGESGPAAAQPLQSMPVPVAGAEGAVSLSLSTAVYARYTCAVLGAGGAKCWGYNRSGQLGTGDSISSASPRAVIGSTNFTSIYSGELRSCALDVLGEAWCWGDARYGELSPLPKAIYSAPVRPVPGTLYSSLAVGAYAVCGIQLGGTASCWGYDFASFGHLPSSDPPEAAQPVRPDLDQPLAQLASDGFNAVYARTRYGQVYMWGETCCDVFTFQPVLLTPNLRFSDLAAGDAQYCVVSALGGLYCGQREKLEGIPDVVGP